MVLAAVLACSAEVEPPSGAPPDPVVDSTVLDVVDSAGPRPGPFRFPGDPAAFSSRVGIDHDPTVQDGLLGAGICTDYLGRAFPHCYDEHHGTDYILTGGFDAMDAGSTEVLAAADGLVTLVVDDNYDRCHSNGGSIDCDGYPEIKNEIKIVHAGGVVSRYFHLMKDSALVRAGDRVVCGQPLAKVGSSGTSSMPHLHFQIEDLAGNWVDPYAGPYSQVDTMWVDQGLDGLYPGTTCAPGP